MIEYIRGELTELTPALAILEAAGVGYGLNISPNAYNAIQGKKEMKLYAYESLVTGGRGDNFIFYGFFSKQKRELCHLLITVSGVGANMAQMILSTLSPAELYNVIANGDERMLKTVKGIGLKTAQHIIVNLRNKIVNSGIATELHANSEPATAADASIRNGAVSTLTMLGFSPAPSAKVVEGILKSDPSLPVRQVVRSALKQIK